MIWFSAPLLWSSGSTAAALSRYPQVYRQDGFLMQGLLQTVAGDFLGDGRTGLAVSGRNYEEKEVFVHLLYWDGSDFKTVWRSPNLWEDASHTAVAAGDFRGSGRPQLAVWTVQALRLFEWNGNTMELVHTGEGIVDPLEVGVIRHPEHPHDLIAVTRRHAVDGLTPLLGIQLWGWRDNRFHPLWETPTVGRIRAITAGSRSGPGKYDFMLEVGEGMGPGTVEVWKWRNGGYEKTFSKPLRAQPAFGLATVTLEGEEVLVAADDRGYVTVHALQGDMPKLGESSALGWALASVTAGDFFGDGGVQAVVAGYPNRLHVVRLTGP